MYAGALLKTATVVQLVSGNNRFVVLNSSYVCPATLGQLNVNSFVDLCTLIGGARPGISSPLVSSTARMVKVTLVSVLFGTPKYQMSFRFVVMYPFNAPFVLTTICSLFVPGWTLLAKLLVSGGP